jgi:hypothetical protein
VNNPMEQSRLIGVVMRMLREGGEVLTLVRSRHETPLEMSR